MTESELTELERLANAASGGPWSVDAQSAMVMYNDDDRRFSVAIVSSARDRNFICAARTALPNLIARVRELEAELMQERHSAQTHEEHAKWLLAAIARIKRAWNATTESDFYEPAGSDRFKELHDAICAADVRSVSP